MESKTADEDVTKTSCEEEATVEFCGSLVRLDCGTEGVYQGLVLKVDPTNAHITIERPFRNGVSLGNQIIQIPGQLITDVLVVRMPLSSSQTKPIKKDGGLVPLNCKSGGKRASPNLTHKKLKKQPSPIAAAQANKPVSILQKSSKPKQPLNSKAVAAAPAVRFVPSNKKSLPNTPIALSSTQKSTPIPTQVYKQTTAMRLRNSQAPPLNINAIPFVPSTNPKKQPLVNTAIASSSTHKPSPKNSQPTPTNKQHTSTIIPRKKKSREAPAAANKKDVQKGTTKNLEQQTQKTTNEMTISLNYKKVEEEKATVCTNLEEVQKKTSELSLKDIRETTQDVPNPTVPTVAAEGPSKTNFVGCLASVYPTNSSDIYQGKIMSVDVKGQSVRLEKPFLNGRPLSIPFIDISGKMMKDIKVVRGPSPVHFENSPINGRHSTGSLPSIRRPSPADSVRSEHTKLKRLSPLNTFSPIAATTSTSAPLNHKTFGDFKLFSREQQQAVPMRLQLNNHRRNIHGPTGMPAVDCLNGYRSYTTDRNAELIMGDPLDPNMETDFDFDGNLALFDKAEFYRETEPVFHGLDSAGDCSRNYRNDENVLQDSSRVISWTKKSTTVAADDVDNEGNHNISTSSPVD
ncbi:hypothetical protein niasHS_008858 [Heterodera schachtii]|uniref:Lsm14-like N-terminal domain-containing protein n=1 Tax=Heterodera schachtii TaxID=97005 RepID=A0ABD2IXL9_HETSC